MSRSSDHPNDSPRKGTRSGLNLVGSFIPPNTDFARRVVAPSAATDSKEESQREPSASAAPAPPVSNLTALMNEHERFIPIQRGEGVISASSRPIEPPKSLDEADSASGPMVLRNRGNLSSSAPFLYDAKAIHHGKQSSVTDIDGRSRIRDPPSSLAGSADVRRCISSKELGTLAPPSGSPYHFLMRKKMELEETTRERLHSLRRGKQTSTPESPDEGSTSSASRRHEGANQLRHRRRAEHNQAIVSDLCEVVTDLFLAESKLLKPLLYGVSEEFTTSSRAQRDHVVKHVRDFLSAFPTRYALSADTPSEVLLHMRLMAAARADSSRAVVHIHNMEGDDRWKNLSRPGKLLRLVTVVCRDAAGLLELITKNLATGGSRVMDADVMISTDGVVLDRFVVEMNGRLLLDKIAHLIEDFLSKDETPGDTTSSNSSGQSHGVPGSLYHHTGTPSQEKRKHSVQARAEMEAAVPLVEVLASSKSSHFLQDGFPVLRRLHSMPARAETVTRFTQQIESPDGATIPSGSTPCSPPRIVPTVAARGDRQGLVNRGGVPILDDFTSDLSAPIDFITVDNTGHAFGQSRDIPIIPFDEIMLIETIGSGRVSTIYRAAWQEGQASEVTTGGQVPTSPVTMVALKVAMVDSSGDTSHVDEVRREADIAARLKHPNICDLAGVAADSECFCLAYEFCEGGSLLSLLKDSSRFYDYLPIALDIANGMAYLHSRDVIHRDLKPSNILLTRDHRAKIADFGMSVTNTGQELTAETGTYRYMAPEVIRHESYSSNADVYSFGLCLWQLITREVPFASMTPVQAAYAVAEGRRPEIPPATPRRLQEIITACWDQDSHRRPSFTYIAMALADYARMAFSPANVGALTLQIANEMLSNVEGNSTVNVDFTTPVASGASPSYLSMGMPSTSVSSIDGDIGLEI